MRDSALRLPELELAAQQVRVGRWHAQVGRTVVAGDKLLEVLADGVAIDLPAPVTGRLTRMLAAPGSQVQTGDRLAVIEPDVD